MADVDRILELIDDGLLEHEQQGAAWYSEQGPGNDSPLVRRLTRSLEAALEGGDDTISVELVSSHPMSECEERGCGLPTFGADGWHGGPSTIIYNRRLTSEECETVRRYMDGQQWPT